MTKPILSALLLLGVISSCVFKQSPENRAETAEKKGAAENTGAADSIFRIVRDKNTGAFSVYRGWAGISNH